MKRMKPEHRGSVLDALLRKLDHEWLCCHGEWNRKKLFLELEQKLRARRRNGKA